MGLTYMDDLPFSSHLSMLPSHEGVYVDDSWILPGGNEVSFVVGSGSPSWAKSCGAMS